MTKPESNSSTAGSSAAIVALLTLVVLAVVILGCGGALFGWFFFDRTVRLETERERALQELDARQAASAEARQEADPQATGETGTGPAEPAASEPARTPVAPGVTPPREDNGVPARPIPPQPSPSGGSVQPLNLEIAEVEGVQTDQQPLRRSIAFQGRERKAWWTQPQVESGAARMAFRLDGSAQVLSGEAAIVASSVAQAAAASVSFRIYGDGNLLWQSPEFSPEDHVHTFQVDVTGIQFLSLLAEAEGQQTSLPLAWLDLGLSAKAP